MYCPAFLGKCFSLLVLGAEYGTDCTDHHDRDRCDEYDGSYAVDQTLCSRSIDDSNERIQAKVKIAADARTPYMLVVGPRDAEQRAVSVRARGFRQDLGATGLEQFVDAVKQEISTRGSFSLMSELFPGHSD